MLAEYNPRILRFLSELLPGCTLIRLPSSPLFGAFSRNTFGLGVSVGFFLCRQGLFKPGAEFIELIAKWGRSVLWFRWRDKRACLEVAIASECDVKPDRQLSGELQARESKRVIVGVSVGRLIPGNPNLVEDVECLRRRSPLGFQSPQEIGLRLIRGGEETEPRRNFLRKQFAELSKFYQTGVWIISKVFFGKKTKTYELLVVRFKKTEI